MYLSMLPTLRAALRVMGSPLSNWVLFQFILVKASASPARKDGVCSTSSQRISRGAARTLPGRCGRSHSTKMELQGKRDPAFRWSSR